MAAPIDVGTAELTGPAVAVVSGLSRGAVGTMNFAVSEDGWLTYLERVEGTGGANGEMVWVTRAGDATPVDPGWRFRLPDDSWGWSLSPDGSQVAFTSVPDGGDPLADIDIWIKELPDGDAQQLTYDDQLELSPEWSPDGEYVTYVKGIMTELDVWQTRADGSGGPELLLDDDWSVAKGGSSPDGEWMVFRTNAERNGPPVDIVGFRPGVDDSMTVLVGSEEFEEGGATISPDGRWLAYTSIDGSGSILDPEVYVRAFPIVDSDPVRVSRNGGANPRWAHSGRELFFIDGDRNMISVAVQTNPDFRVLQRETLFPISSVFSVGVRLTGFDISSDDQRFLMVRRTFQGGNEATRTVLVQNFFEVLKERVGN